jgi:hypothetical protein
MPIPLVFLERIKAAPMSGAQVADAFAKLAKVADDTGMDDCAINIEYVGDTDILIAGDLIPMLTLSLVRQPENRVYADAIEVASTPVVQPMRHQAEEMPNPFYDTTLGQPFQPAEAAVDMDDEDPYPEE